jgi:hypothetical protein
MFSTSILGWEERSIDQHSFSLLVSQRLVQPPMIYTVGGRECRRSRETGS